jgi:hypothetical protein
MAKKPRAGAPISYKDPIALEEACFEYVFMSLALVAWQALAVGHLLCMRGSLKPLSGRESVLKPHFYVPRYDLKSGI